MRAAVLRDAGKPFEIEDVELGALAAHEILVRVVGAGMCHTDLVARTIDLPAQIGPCILGHEGSGVVEQVGCAVTKVGVGDHVLMSFDSCGVCAQCMQGSPPYCDDFNRLNAGGVGAGSTHARDAKGGVVANRWFGQSSFAEYAVATERNVVAVDRDLPLELLGPLGCGLQTGAGTVLNEMKLRAGQSIAVFGAGAVGLAAIMAAKIAGASDIVAVDLHRSRLDLAEELGAHRTVLGTADDIVAEVRAGSSGMNFTFETTAATPVIETAVKALASRGSAILVGAGGGEVRVRPSLLAGRTLTFGREGGAVPQLFIPKLIDYWTRGLFPFDRLVKTYRLDEINDAETDSLSGRTIKPVILPFATSTR